VRRYLALLLALACASSSAVVKNQPPATANSGVTQIVAGTNVTLSPSGGTGAVTVNATGGTSTFGNVTFSGAQTSAQSYLWAPGTTLSGSVTAPASGQPGLQEFYILSDTVDASSVGLNDIMVLERPDVGYKGGRNGIFSEVFVVGAPATSTSGGPMVAGQFLGNMGANQGGTSGYANLIGGVWGITAGAIQNSQYGSASIAGEFDQTVLAPTGSKYGVLVVQAAGDTTRGTYNDAAIDINSQAASDTWLHGLEFGSYDQQWPFGTDSTLIGAVQRQSPSTNTPVALYGVDFSAVTFQSGGCAFKSTSFCIDPSGNATAASAGISGGVQSDNISTLLINGTETAGTSSTLAGASITEAFAPTSATPATIIGLVASPALDNAGGTVVAIEGITATALQINSDYTHTTPLVVAYNSACGTWTDSRATALTAAPAANYCYLAQPLQIGNGITSGTVSNIQVGVSNTSLGALTTASAALGGTMLNYGVKIQTPTGSGAGSTTNYGLFISGNGGTGGSGTTTNWAIDSTSTAPSQVTGGFNNTPIGATTASTGAFTTLSASSTVSGGSFRPSSSGLSSSQLYLPATNTPAISANGVEAQSWTSTLINDFVPHTSVGTTFTVSGCGTAGSVTGGSAAGSFTVGTGTTNCTFTITLNGASGSTAAHGWILNMDDVTAGIHCINSTTVSTTTAVGVCTGTVATNDVIKFSATGY
jgi:hypothetical protein